MADVKSSEPVPLDTIPVSPNGPMTDATNGATNGDKVVTVFDDPANFNVKHQLQHTWTLWFTKPPNGKQDWNELLKEVISFNSVEEFWGIYVSCIHLHSQAVGGAWQSTTYH
jgi:translation initiation factor 4E